MKFDAERLADKIKKQYSIDLSADEIFNNASEVLDKAVEDGLLIARTETKSATFFFMRDLSVAIVVSGAIQIITPEHLAKIISFYHPFTECAEMVELSSNKKPH